MICDASKNGSVRRIRGKRKRIKPFRRSIQLIMFDGWSQTRGSGVRRRCGEDGGAERWLRRALKRNSLTTQPEKIKWCSESEDGWTCASGSGLLHCSCTLPQVWTQALFALPLPLVVHPFFPDLLSFVIVPSSLWFFFHCILFCFASKFAAYNVIISW